MERLLPRDDNVVALWTGSRNSREQLPLNLAADACVSPRTAGPFEALN